MNLLQYTVEAYGLSDVGLVRPNNEDVFQILPDKKFYILAHGMGGHNAGEIAALKAVESVCTSVEELEKFSTTQEICNLLRNAIALANQKVYTLSHQNKAYSGMGTTLCCFHLSTHQLIYAHIGDSRLYRLRNKLEKLTEDHSLRHTMLHSEDQPSPELPAQLFRNIITRAIGTYSYVIPDIGVISIKPGDVFLLCSDGLSDFVSEEEIAQAIGTSCSLAESANKLIHCALDKGGNDNVTVLLVKIHS